MVVTPARGLVTGGGCSRGHWPPKPSRDRIDWTARIHHAPRRSRRKGRGRMLSCARMLRRWCGLILTASPRAAEPSISNAAAVPGEPDASRMPTSWLPISRARSRSRHPVRSAGKAAAGRSSRRAQMPSRIVPPRVRRTARFTPRIFRWSGTVSRPSHWLALGPLKAERDYARSATSVTCGAGPAAARGVYVWGHGKVTARRRGVQAQGWRSRFQ